MSRQLLQHFRLRAQFKQGNWSDSLLEQAGTALQRKLTSRSLLDYLDIRHAIQGYSPSSVQHIMQQAESLGRELTPELKLRITALCLEYKIELPAYLQPPVSKKMARYPSVLAQQSKSIINAKQEKLGHLIALAKNIQQRTHVLTDSFSQSGKIKRICVVGNAATEIGKYQQQAIDSADIVFRFNSAVTNNTYSEAYGSRTDYWVVSPSYSVQASNLKANRIVLSGVSPFHKPSIYWQTLANIQQTEYFVFPKSVWYSLVAELKAPPSAGLLCLATLINWRPKATTIETYGINNAAVSTQNHYSDNNKRSTRHNWTGESLLVKQLMLGAG